MSLLAESSPRSRTWRANSDATSVTTTTPPNPSSGPTATPHIESLLIPFHPLQATRGMRAVWGRSWEGGGAPAYWPWVQILRSLVFDSKSTRTRSAAVVPEVAKLIPELASEAHGEPPSDPKQAQFRLFDAVTTALKDAARAQPLVLILDDLHEADQSSLEMMKFIARALPESY